MSNNTGRQALEARLIIDGRAGVVPMRGAGPWLLGRGTKADIAFPVDKLASREQAWIVREADGFAIQPLSKTVPTTLNGNPITGPTALADGVKIGFGDHDMIFSQGPAGRTGADRTSGAGAVPDRLRLDRDLTIGRQALPGHFVLDHPGVSRLHASFSRTAQGVVVRDLDSTNGTFVNGVRITGAHLIAVGDRIDIGPVQFTFDGAALTSLDRTGNAELMVSNVCLDVRDRPRGTKRILDGVTFRIQPREFICIVGASGSGKSTLMNIMAGRAKPSGGVVELNGSDLHRSFEALKRDIAFVPQQDVLHEQLTLRQALDYAARLRLPNDTSTAQRRAAVETAARDVDLFDRLDMKIGRLSGGQKKRASLASEILNRPSLLFLDEVTSGLDESTDREIMRLLRRLAGDGMTIVAVTHTLANVEAFCHKVICVGQGGHVVYFGPPAEALSFFGVKRLGEIFDRIHESGTLHWRKRYEQLSPAAFAAVASVRGGGAVPVTGPRDSVLRHLRRVGRQWWILTNRNTRLLFSDHRALVMAAVQSCLIGGLTGYAFGSFGTAQEEAANESALLFLLGLTSLWLGCNGASKDIVGELVIYQRERDINLSTAAYVASKFFVTGLFTMVQLGVVFALTAALAKGIPGAMPSQLAILMGGVLTGTAIGLVISAFSNTRDQATTIVPLALVPQIILGGVLVPNLPAPAQLFSKLAISSYWLTEGMKSVFIATEGKVMVFSAAARNMVEMTAQQTGTSELVIAIHGMVFLLIAFLATLIRHDGHKRTG